MTNSHTQKKSTQERIYENKGNLPLLDLIDDEYLRILDIGCGSGDNAALIKSRYPRSRIFGITHSTAEAELARRHMEHCWVADLETAMPPDLHEQSFDLLLFSHVLEHLRTPEEVLCRYTTLLRSGGLLLIAVPNILSWRMRIKFLRGHFDYETAGVLDDTHLRFFTYLTADKYLLSRTKGLKDIDKSTDGSIPLWWFRRHVLPGSICKRIDAWGCRHWPNLFSGQVLIKAVKS